MAPMTTHEYLVDGGGTLKTGDRAYNEISRMPGVIGQDNGDGWFFFEQDSGQVVLLNGPRICSMLFARLRNFPRADAS